MEKARALGKQIMTMAKRSISREEESASEEERNPRHRRSYAEVVSSEERGSSSPAPTPQPKLKAAAMKGASSKNLRTARQQKYTPEEIITVLRKAQKQPTPKGEWKEVTHKSSLKRQISAVKEEFKREGKKRAMECWNCQSKEHLSRNCPCEVLCRYCHEAGHLIGECPVKAKGKRLLKMEEAEPKPQREKKHVTQQVQSMIGARVAPIRDRNAPTKRLFINMTEEMINLKQKLKKELAVVRIEFGEPSVDDIIDSL